MSGERTRPAAYAGVRLTAKQRRAVLLLRAEDVCNEGLLASEWPLIRRPRLIVNALVDKGLIELRDWIDEEVGYEFVLTPRGQDVARELFAAVEVADGQ